VQQAQAALAQAKLNLDYTTVKAEADGIVSKKSLEAGQVVQAGQPLLAIVQTEDVWVTANYKETQLKDIRVGQAATVSVDALGGKKFAAHVDSIAPATGAKFSLLPAENATGNFVKVVQRVPVKLALEPGADRDHLLKPGLSATATVRTK
jgi:membrane fusion protein (multidrug efflux system)